MDKTWPNQLVVAKSFQQQIGRIGMEKELTNVKSQFSETREPDQTLCNRKILQSMGRRNKFRKESCYSTLLLKKDQGSMQMTSNTFGIARCTVGHVIQEMCDILTKYLRPELIKFPIEKDEILGPLSQFQQRFGFPQVIGCIDGTHIPIKQLQECP